jgi:hypothetical protein
MTDALASIGGPMLRAWQSDPWNKQVRGVQAAGSVA